MLRDLAIVATAFGVRMDEFRKTGLSGIISLFAGVIVSFAVGACVAYAFGYRDAISITTIGGGAATYIVGPVTATALVRVVGSRSSERCHRADQVDLGDDHNSICCPLHRTGQSKIGVDLRRIDGHDQRRRWRTGRNRSETRSLRSDDGDVLHRTGLPARSVARVHGDPSYHVACHSIVVPAVPADFILPVFLMVAYLMEKE